MATKVWLSDVGAPVDPEHARISVFDRGFLYGDSVYETLRTAGGHPLELRRHLVRLRRSADGIGMTLGHDDDAIERAIVQTHGASGNPESYVRVVVTRGQGPILLDPRTSTTPTLVVIVQALVVPSDEAYERGLHAVIVGGTKTGGGLLDPAVKSGNYLGSILALGEAIARGGEDAILSTAEGRIAEGATSNVFAVVGGRLVTPAQGEGLLAGITREVVIELAREIGLPVAEVALDRAALVAADEVFLTSSVRGIMPVTLLDGETVGSGMGPVTRRVRARYLAYLEDAARAPR
jgi:branched-chain amino acid aminotransferase